MMAAPAAGIRKSVQSCHPKNAKMAISEMSGHGKPVIGKVKT